MSPTVLGRIMIVLGYFILVSVMSLQAMARELAVFAVQKNLQMSNKDPVYHDYYLDGGTESGLRTGQLVTVVRRIPLHDLTRNRPLGDMHLPVAQLKIIYAQRGSSVARVHKLFQDKNRPVLDFGTVMVGDRVSESGADEEEGEAPGAGANEAQPASEAPAKTLPEKSTEKADASSVAPAAPPAVEKPKTDGAKPKPVEAPAAAPKT